MPEDGDEADCDDPDAWRDVCDDPTADPHGENDDG